MDDGARTTASVCRLDREATFHRNGSAGAAETEEAEGKRRLVGAVNRDDRGDRAEVPATAANQRAWKPAYGALSEASEIASVAGRPAIAAVRLLDPVRDPLREVSDHVVGTP